MGKMARSYVQSIMKMVNSVIGLVGFAMIIYACWLFRVWQRSVDDSDYPPPWFTYTFLGLGASLCVITCLGYIAAETVNGCCLFLDFPEDSTGELDDLKGFIKKNFEMCKWIGLSILTTQGLCVLFAMILKALGPHRKTLRPPPYVAKDPLYESRKDSWNVGVRR